MMNLKRGDILIVRSRHIVGHFIRWATKGKVDHVAHYLGNDLILETRFGTGVVITRLDTLKKCKVYVGRVKEAIHEDIEVVSKWLGNQVGEKYDSIQIITMMWHRIAKTLHRRTHLDSSKLDVCSTLLAEAWYRCGFIFNENIHINNISPNDIYTSSIIEVREEEGY